MKKYLLLTALIISGLTLCEAQEARPAYCDGAPTTYGNVVAPPGSGNKAPLPRFATTPVKEYKVQVAILRESDPADFPFHPLLVARYRPCEEVWVIESRESYSSRSEVEALQRRLIDLGYQGAYITDLIAYQ